MLREIALLLAIFMISTKAVPWPEYYHECDRPDRIPCNLPDCYCKYYDIPGGFAKENTPQMVLFTYTGALTSTVRQAITDVFPNSWKNPNRCAIGITLFVVSDGTDDCGLHKMYVRGHEVALSGLNRSTNVDTWNQAKWEEVIIGQRSHIEEKSNIDASEIVGMRAQRLRAGGNPQFDMMANNDLLYDSSLIAGPGESLDAKMPYLWPVTLGLTWEKHLKQNKMTCKNQELLCPNNTYKDIWEVPVAPLVGQRSGKKRQCSYLDDCLTDYSNGKQVLGLLKEHFYFTYNGNRAPMQINLQARTMETEIAVDGLKEFIRFLITKPDTWLLTTHEAIQWVKTPMVNIMNQSLWKCPDRKYVKCTEGDRAKNNTMKSATFRTILDVDNLWIWQSVLLVVAYIVVKKYDTYISSKKKK